MIQSVWKNLTGLQKDKSIIPAEHLCVTLNTDLEPKIHHQTPFPYIYICCSDDSPKNKMCYFILTLKFHKKYDFGKCW